MSLLAKPKHRSVIRMAGLCLALALAGCSSSPERPLPPAPPQVAEFFAHLKADSNHQWLEDESDKWLAAQPTGIRVLVAERAMREADPAVRLLAPMQFYAMGMDDRGDAAIAELALRGDEVGAFSWSWLHDRDAGMFKRRLSAIRRIILSRYDELTPGQRASAEHMLCDDGQPCDLRAEAEALKRQPKD